MQTVTYREIDCPECNGTGHHFAIDILSKEWNETHRCCEQCDGRGYFEAEDDDEEDEE